MKRFIALALGLTAGMALAPAYAAPDTNASGVEPSAAPGDLGSAIMSAVVSATGVVNRGEGVTTASSLGAGFYEVVFGRDVTSCTYSLNTGGTDFDSPNGQGSATKRGGNANAVFVAMRNSAGTGADLAFHLIVYCGR